MKSKPKKSPAPPKTSGKKPLSFKHESWYEQTYKNMAISLRKSSEVRFNFLARLIGRSGS